MKSVRTRNFSGPYFLAFGLNTERDTEYLTRKSPNTNTFDTALVGRLRTNTNWGKSYGKVGQVIYYKVGQWLLQSGACTTKWGNFCYKVEQILQSRKVITK